MGKCVQETAERLTAGVQGLWGCAGPVAFACATPGCRPSWAMASRCPQDMRKAPRHGTRGFCLPAWLSREGIARRIPEPGLPAAARSLGQVVGLRKRMAQAPCGGWRLRHKRPAGAEFGHPAGALNRRRSGRGMPALSPAGKLGSLEPPGAPRHQPGRGAEGRAGPLRERSKGTREGDARFCP